MGQPQTHMDTPVGDAPGEERRRRRRRRRRSSEGRQAPQQSTPAEGEERPRKRERTEREIQMVTAADEAAEIGGQCVREIMDGQDFEDVQGKWMRETLYELMKHPQVRQYHDEVKMSLKDPVAWKNAEARFYETLVDHMDAPIEGLLDRLRNSFRCLFSDQLPSENPEFALLGIPQLPVRLSWQEVEGPLVCEHHGVMIRLRAAGWWGADGGIFVGRSKPGLPGFVTHEDYGKLLENAQVREALYNRPLYVDEGEESLARELIEKYELRLTPAEKRMPWAAAWLATWRRLLSRSVPLTYAGVALKMLIRSRPGSLGNFVRVFKCCAVRNFQGRTEELLPVKLPEDSMEEKAAFELLIKASAPEVSPDASEWTAIEEKCAAAGHASWTWLQVMALNALYLGGGTERTLSQQMVHSAELTKGQTQMMTRIDEMTTAWLEKGHEPVEVKPWDDVSQGLEGVYTGPEVKKAYPLTVKAIRPTTPGPGEAARIQLADAVAPELRNFVLDPELLRIPEADLVNPQTTAKVHVESDAEWDAVVAHLVTSGMLEREEPSETLKFKGEEVRNGAFGVHKSWQQDESGDFFRTLRLIINLIPSNGFQRKAPWRPSQKMGYSPLWGQMVVLEDEIVMSYGEDQRHCFHIYKPGPKWRGGFVLNKKASGWAFGDDRAEAAYPRVKSAPMGWSNVVDFIQSGLENMGAQAGMSIKQSVRMGEALPALPLDTPRTYYSWYVDNWDSFKIVAQSTRGEYEGVPSEEQLKLRQVFQLWDVGRDPKKSAEGTLEWSSLGAEVDGNRGWIGSNTKFRRGVLGATLNLLGQEKVRGSSQELQAIVSKHMHSVQFCRPLASTFDHLYRELACLGGGGANLSTLARDELLLLSSLLPQHWLNQHRRPSGKVFATDASETGGGACETTGLSEWGYQRIHGLSYADDGLEGALADNILVIEVFAGMGGLKQALELIGIMPQGIISIDNDATSKKISRQHCRHVICYDDVKTITKEMVSEWRRQFPRATRVLLAGGWPCIHHSALNVNRQGTEGATSQLFDNMMDIRDWLTEVQYDHNLPGWEVLEMYENVVMDEKDLTVQSKKIGWLPVFLEAADLGPCRRPRLYWLRNIELIEGTDLTVEKNARVRDLDLPLNRVVIKTTPPGWEKFLQPGAKKLSNEKEPFYTFTRPILRKEPPASPAGVDRASQKALKRWQGDGYRLPPYAYEDANLALDKSGPRRLLPEEQLRMLGFTSSHLTLKQKLTNDQKGHFVGNSFSAIAVARLLAGLAVDKEIAAQADLTAELWKAWESLEGQVGRDQQPWRARFGQGARAELGVVAMRRRVLPPADLPLQAKLDPKNRLTDEELLAYLLTRQAVHKGCDIRMDRNVPFTYGNLARHSIDPGNWKWKVLLSYNWKQGGQHINVLETTTVLDLARKLARDPKNHGLRSILLIDNVVSLLHGSWNRAELPDRALPFTPLIAYGLAQLAFEKGWEDLCLILLLGFTVFARTGELFSARAGDFVFDTKMKKGVWSLPLTKSGQRAGVRESLTIEDSWLLVALKRYCATLQPGDTLRRVSPQLMRTRFKELLQKSGLPDGFALYSLRRGGATHAFRRSNNLSWVCLVGRWSHEKTARIYITDALAQLTDITLESRVRARLYTLARKARPGYTFE
eukprot:s1016_g8.t1